MKFGKLVLIDDAPRISILFSVMLPREAKDIAILWSFEALIILPPLIF